MILTVLVLIYTDTMERLIPSPVPLLGICLQTEYFRAALHSYLLSLSGSIWGTSPILLLAVPVCGSCCGKGDVVMCG